MDNEFNGRKKKIINLSSGNDTIEDLIVVKQGDF